MTAIETLTQRAFGPPGDDMHAHLLPLYTLARFLPSYRTLEIGCDDGSSTLPLLIGTAQNGGVMISIDPADCSPAHELVRSVGLQDQWTHAQQLSEDFEMPWTPDLVFIDGDHSYDAVWADFDLHGSIVREGGLCVFHDSAAADFPGVLEVVEQIKSRGGFEVLTLPWCFGLTICRRIA